MLTWGKLTMTLSLRSPLSIRSCPDHLHRKRAFNYSCCYSHLPALKCLVGFCRYCYVSEPVELDTRLFLVCSRAVVSKLQKRRQKKMRISERFYCRSYFLQVSDWLLTSGGSTSSKRVIIWRSSVILTSFLCSLVNLKRPALWRGK